MITAKNYAAQAEKFLRENLRGYMTARDYDSLMDQFVDEIKHSVHFALPDTGSIFDDDKKGIRGEKVRLPFPKITIEYYCPEIKEIDDDSIWASKRLIYAQEVLTKDLREMIDAANRDQQDIVRRAVVNFDDEDDYSDEFMDYDGDDASTWPGANYGDDDNDELDFNLDDRIFDDEDDIDDEEVEGLFDDLRESLDMFKRFTKYN